MNEPIPVVIADDHPLCRESIATSVPPWRWSTCRCPGSTATPGYHQNVIEDADFLRKPFGAATLTARVAEVLLRPSPADR